ncbi:MAG TPA: type II secretion system F family protein, partial [Pseudomonadales bacterium]|nr:type II secretion system F family protein [Pseudomonadales bacterium]
ELYRQLGSMITAGVPLIQALQMSSNNSALRASRKTMSALVGHLQNGLTFSDSMSRVQGWMPEFDKALLSAGEHSGRLDWTFKLLANDYASRAAIIREMLWQMLRTILTLHVLLLIFPLGPLIGLAFAVRDGNPLEAIPFFLWRGVAFSILYGSVFLLIFACQGRHGEGWRSMVESIMRIIPVLRKAQQYLVLSRLASTLEALVNTDVSIIKAWPVAASASGSPYLKRLVATWASDLEHGHTPAQMVSISRYFPEMFANLYHTGEVSGKLDESLNRLQTYYREEGFLALRIFTRVLNGVVYSLVVVVVAYFFITFWLNYYKNLLGGV